MEPPEGFAFWFGKPKGVTYEALDKSLRGLLTRAGVALWQRQLVLGPTPEFCLRSPRADDGADLPRVATVTFRRVVSPCELALSPAPPLD